MATQATLAVLRKRGAAAGVRVPRALNSKSVVDVQRPTWYPYDGTEVASKFRALGSEKADLSELVKVAVRIQAVFRGFRARKYATKVFHRKVLISKPAFLKVANEIKRLHLGWNHFCIHTVLFALVLCLAYFQFLAYRPSAHSQEYALLRALEDVSTSDGVGFADVSSLAEAKAFVRSMAQIMAHPDPYPVASTKSSASTFVSDTTEAAPEILQNFSLFGVNPFESDSDNVFTAVVDLGLLNLPQEFMDCALSYLFEDVHWVDQATSELCASVVVQNLNAAGRYGYMQACFRTDVTTLVLHLIVLIRFLRFESSSRQFQPFAGSYATTVLLGVREIVQFVQEVTFTMRIYSMLLIFMVIRTVKHLDFHPDTGIISRTLSRSASDILSFLFVYLVVVLSYAFIGLLMYSPYGEAFGSYFEAVTTLLFVSMGEFDATMDIIFSDSIEGDVWISQIFFWTYVFFTTLVLFNILLSIVVESFVSFQESSRASPTISFLQSMYLSSFITLYDVRNYHIPVAVGLAYRICAWKIDFGANDSLGLSLLFHDGVSIEHLTTHPHRYDERLQFLRMHVAGSVPTFALRQELLQAFPESMVERLLWLFRQRTEELRPSDAREEVDMLFSESASQLYIIDQLKQVTNRLDAIAGHQQRRTVRTKEGQSGSISQLYNRDTELTPESSLRSAQ
ncbi:Polycystin-2 [Hondaea fermentalgiana]|uniref:Polycystin-2 n=1 Tax=Hondaea fermentalgiana TaxID=2315210 RepID=A0A2R5G9U9_9STRA|nr:Polycystin-2 [Hondaea fermentalgiana]|eukprot:GBG27826.1 Polycystin-2 [Hondaea fermentalgiana]